MKGACASKNATLGEESSRKRSIAPNAGGRMLMEIRRRTSFSTVAAAPPSARRAAMAAALAISARRLPAAGILR